MNGPQNDDAELNLPQFNGFDDDPPSIPLSRLRLMTHRRLGYRKLPRVHWDDVAGTFMLFCWQDGKVDWRLCDRLVSRVKYRLRQWSQGKQREVCETDLGGFLLDWMPGRYAGYEEVEADDTAAVVRRRLSRTRKRLKYRRTLARLVLDGRDDPFPGELSSWARYDARTLLRQVVDGMNLED